MTSKRESTMLRAVTSRDLALVINDLELENGGYIVNYIVDPFDILRFCFPYGSMYNLKRSIDEIGDEMIAYSYLFRYLRPITLDEYKPELISIRRSIAHTYRKNVGQNLLQTLEHKLKSGDEDAKAQIYHELEKSATFLLSTALLTTHFVKAFDEIYQELLLDQIELPTEFAEDENAVVRAFRENRRSNWSSDAFREWVRERDTAREFRTKTKSLLSNELKSAYIDFIAIDRICRINRQLQTQSDLRGKYLFLYFSSAPKSEQIFNRAMTQTHLPSLAGNGSTLDRYNLHRSAKHAFLQFLFWDEDRNKTIGDLRRLQAMAIKHESTSFTQDLRKAEEMATEHDNSFLSEVAGLDLDELDIIKERRLTRLEDHRIKVQISKHRDYQTSLETTIERFGDAYNDYPRLKQLYEDLLQRALSVDLKRDLLAFIAIDYSVQSNLSLLLRMLINDKTLTISKGVDLIEGSYHHLPVLLFLRRPNSINHELDNLLNEVVDFVAKSPRMRRETLSEFFVKIRSLYSKSERVFASGDISSRAELYYPTNLIKSLIFLMLPARTERILVEREAYNSTLDASVLLDTGSQPLDEWKPEYDYFRIWSSRRCGEYDESLRLASAAIVRDSSDPRFFHGKCLALHNIFTIDNLHVNNSEHLPELVLAAETAIALYKQLLDSPDVPNPKLVRGSIAALQNTILYALLVGHLDAWENGTHDEFKESDDYRRFTLSFLEQEFLEPMKKFERDMRQEFEDLPEFEQTVAVLELCKAIECFTGVNKSEAELCINRAYEAIRQSLSEGDSKLYQDTLNLIQRWQIKIDELA